MNRHVPPPQTSRAAPTGAVPVNPAAAPSRIRIAARDQEAADAYFRAARRHSGRVRFLRRALPLGVVLGLGIATLFAFFDPLKIAVDLPFELGKVSLSGSRIMMEMPKLSGFTDDNRGYAITAKSASQDLTQPNQIDLQEIEARIELAEQGWAKLTAQAGRYDTKNEKMELSDGINIDTSAGYGGRLQEAKIDVRAGTLLSEKPVELNYLDGKLTADRMEVSQKEARALLTGRVHLVFKMPPPKEGEAGAAAPAAVPAANPAPMASPAPAVNPAPEAGPVPPSPPARPAP